MNNVRYVGITKREPLNRFVEHLSSRTERAALRYYPIKGAQGLSRIQARIIEQRLINTYGLGSNGGRVTGISKTKPRMRHLINVKEPLFLCFEA